MAVASGFSVTRKNSVAIRAKSPRVMVAFLQAHRQGEREALGAVLG